jgi:ribonuclease P protein component
LKKKLAYPRKHRLLSKTEFKAVFDNAKKISQKHLLILYKTNQNTHSRLGLVVGKHFAKKAASRNRIKRVIRESFRHYQENIKGMDIIVIARQQCDTLTKHKLREGIDNLWEKLKT